MGIQRLPFGSAVFAGFSQRYLPALATGFVWFATGCGNQTPAFTQKSDTTLPAGASSTQAGSSGSGDATVAGTKDETVLPGYPGGNTTGAGTPIGSGGGGVGTGQTTGGITGVAGGSSGSGTGGTVTGATTSGGTSGGTGGTTGLASSGTTGGTSGDTGGGTTSASTGGTTSSSAGGTTSGSTGGTASGSTGGTTSGSTGGTTAGSTTAGSTTGGSTGSESTVNIHLHTVETTQKTGGKVDILWIIDDSASMSPEQDNVAVNFNAFITQLADFGLDFQTAVTTTDVCQDTMPSDLTLRVCPVDNYGGSPATHLRGAFFGDVGHTVLKATDSDLVSRFNTYVRQGADGSDFEHGLTAAHEAIDKSINGINAPFIRPEAFLAVIVLSDEEDDGIGLGMVDAFNMHNFWTDGVTRYRYTDDDFIAYAKGIKGEGNFSVSGIVGTRNADGSMCSSSVASPREEGTQYIKAAQKTGGIIRSVCDTNWGDSMTQIGRDLTAQASQVVLPTVPDTATIDVYVDGVLTKNWTFNAANNAVKFNTASVPMQGAAIKIVYVDIQ